MFAFKIGDQFEHPYLGRVIIINGSITLCNNEPHYYVSFPYHYKLRSTNMWLREKELVMRGKKIEQNINNLGQQSVTGG